MTPSCGKLYFAVPRDTVYSASHGGMIQYLGGSPYRKAERRPYKGIGRSRKMFSYDNCRGTYLHNHGTGAWAESPSIEKIPIVLNT